jgi:O-antigen ligase
MTSTLSFDIEPTTVRLEPAVQTPRPGLLERFAVGAALFVLLHGLPVDWFATRDDFLNQDGNLKMVAAQLFLMGLGVAHFLGNLDWLIRIVRLDVPLFLFTAMTGASMFWSADPAETIKQAIVFSTITLFGAYLVLRFSLREILFIHAQMFTLSAIINIAFVAAFPTYAITDELWDGVFFQKNALGFTATLAIPTLVVAARSNPRWRLPFYSAAAVFFVLLLGSESKTMLLATIASLLLLVIYRLFRGHRTLKGAVLVALVGSSLFTVAFATANVAVLADWLDKDISLTGRVPLWEMIIPLISERPLLGYGYGATFGGYFSPIHEIWVQATWNPTHAHNAILQIWLEMGIIAVVLFLITLIRSIGRAMTMVGVVQGSVGLWPLMFLSSTLLISITESGISAAPSGWLLYVVAILSSAHYASRQAKVRRGPAGPPVFETSVVIDEPIGKT